MKRFAGLLTTFLLSCGAPPENVPPFISITLVDPEGFSSPQADLFKVVNRAIVDGSPISKEFEINAPDLSLPTSFSISFSEGLRGSAVEVEIHGFSGGQEVFLATDSIIADVSSVEMTARFCGDDNTNADRGEQCDNGLGNSDTEPNACRALCLLPICGDGVVDTNSGEECDDGNALDADGCEADCTLPACGNGIFEPEDFRGFTDGGNSEINPEGSSIITFLSTESYLQEHKFVTSNEESFAMGLGDFDKDGFVDVVVADTFDPNSGASFLRLFRFNP